MNIVQRAVVTLKAAALRWSTGRSWFWGGLGRTGFDYAANVRNDRNSVVMACVLWIGRTFPEAPVRVRTRKRSGDLEPAKNHPLVALLRRPNPYYSGDLLWMATLGDWVLTGNAYWVKVRSAVGGVTELWWVPSRFVEPKGERTFLDVYEYTVDGRVQRFDPADVVHFRYGLDPDNPRKGLSPLASLAREVFTDDEAANFSAALLKNLGVPGVVISPDSDVYEPSQEDLEQMKTEFAQKFGGDNRGSALVMRGKTKVQVLSFSPDQMNLRDLRALPEERVSAILGIPAAVVGLGTGLANTKVGATMAEMREQAYESNLIPTWRLFAAEIGAQLLPDVGDPRREEVDFDTSEVRVLQPDLDKKFARLDVAVRGGWMMPNEAREEVGLDGIEGGDVIYVPSGVTPTDPASLIPPEPEPAEVPAADAPGALEAPAPLRALPPGKDGKVAGESTVDGTARRPAAGSPLDGFPSTRDDGSDIGRPNRPGHREYKAIGHYTADAIHRLRDRHQAALEQDLSLFLLAQRERVVIALGLKAYGPPVAGTRAVPDVQLKAIDWRAVFDAVVETRALTEMLEDWYRTVLLSVKFLAEDAVGMPIRLDEPTTLAYLRDAGREIAGITETTRKAVVVALREAEAAGESIPVAARRLEQLAAFSRQRATTIARTELGHAANLAALASYRASGVVLGVRVFDGDGCGLTTHDDPRKADGVRLRLDQMAGVPTLAHPRCRRAFGAVIDPLEMEGVA